MFALALGAMTKTDYFGDHIRALREMKGLSYPRMVRRLATMGVTDDDGKAPTLGMMKQWAADNVRLRPHIQKALVEAYDLPVDFFEKPVDKNASASYDVQETHDAQPSMVTESEEAAAFVRVPLVYLRPDAMIHQLLVNPLATIRVPRWFPEAKVNAVRVDADGYHPYADRGDALITRPNDTFRAGKMTLVSRKSDGAPFLVNVVRESGRTILFGPGLERSPADDFHNDGLVIAKLSNYIEGKALGTIDDTGIDAPEYSG